MKLALAAKADHVELVLKTGRTIKLPPKAFLFHDETGRAWPKRSVFLDSYYKLGGERVEIDGTAKGWLGRNYEARKGFVDVPPKDISLWQPIGELQEIYYVRRGIFAPGRFHHAFKRERFLFPDHGPTILSKHGAYYRVDLPKTGLINWRGFVQP